ncbi:outer membrane usher protein [Enterobacter sp. BIGb0383]|uniref:fimbria/pilus outer membrane usher protein n=1 Tax=unclassified Enterobacter TaxID=2608935 RepID=UPI000F4A5034|nr:MULTISPECIES: fimbria/pilus outer membrane usher protein [unclassified Enterobacter]ROP62501.1 outer membrane usher protein [Enterobacter sp. BIGb0383]ROS12661.1 outer membrane usher protein [Enterobacter sp. BIGb0359]
MAVCARQLTVPAILLLLSTATSGRAETGDDPLPPPPDVSTINAQAVYHLGLVINYYDTELVVAATRRQDDFYVANEDLQKAGLPADKLPPGEVNLSSLEEVRTEYDDVAQRLLLFVPREWLPERMTSFNEQNGRVDAMSGKGALLNYDFYTSRTPDGGSQANVWHELRYFNNDVSVSSTGFIRRYLAGEVMQSEKYLRYDTTLTLTDEDNATQWKVGDVISDSLVWSSSVRVGGISYGRDFSLRPDLVTWPLPVFSGEAAVPTAVDLFIDGYRAGSTRLQPGPFTLTNLPYINGAGNAVVVTTDAAGRQVRSELPFYVTSELLKPGISDGAITLGALRRRYGIDNFDYGPMVGSGSLRYGVTDYLTLETHVEGAEELALGGGGAVVKLGQFGVVNGSLTQSRMRGSSGQQINWGYQYNTSMFSITTQHTRRDTGFGNLALYDTPMRYDENMRPIVSLSRSVDQYSLSMGLGDFGNIGAAWFGVRSYDNKRTELLNLSWSRNLWGNSSLYLSASRDRQVGDWTVAMSLQIPFGALDNVGLTMEQTPDRGRSERITYNHSMPTDGGFSWNMAWAQQSKANSYRQATLGWRNSAVELQGGGYGQSDEMVWWGEAMGSLVLMDGQLFAANKVNDAFVVVSTHGYPDVPVSYENQRVGQTDKDGYLLISGVSAYYPASYSIDTLDLPADTRLKETQRRVALRRNSGYLVEFPMEQQRVASVILHDEQGEAIPVGSQVRQGGGVPAPVGYDGLTFLENLADVNPLRIIKPDGSSCNVTLTLTPNPQRKLQTYGPLICRGGH